MSVDAVLHMPPRVQDLVEVPKPPVREWDVYSPGYIIENSRYCEVAAAVLVPDLASYPRAQELANKNFKEHLQGVRMIEPTSVESEDSLHVQDFMSELVAVNLLSGNRIVVLSTDDMRIVRAEIENIFFYRDLSSRSGLNDMKFLRDCFIALPEEDFTVHARRIAERDPSFFRPTELSQHTSSDIRESAALLRIERIAAMKMVNPRYYNDIDLASTDVYKEGVRILHKNGDGYVELAGSLKILAAEEIVIDNGEIHLRMPDTAMAVPASAPLPETRRFGK